MIKKILIVDDSALMRRVMSDIIAEDEQLTVADTAKNGQNALQILAQGKHYDMILLDLKMPKMDGVGFLREWKKTGSDIPVLVVSSIASESAKETIEALELGAFDFVKKPSERVGKSFMGFRRELLLRIYTACGLRTEHLDDVFQKKERKPVEKEPVSSVQIAEKRASEAVQKAYAAVKDVMPEAAPAKPQKKIPPVVRKGDRLYVIASSTGGPKALQSVLPCFPAGFSYPIVVVQHMPAGFTASLAERLDEMSPLQIKEAEDGEILKAGCIYIAPGGKQCELIQKEAGRYYLSVTAKPPRGGLRPCADIFLESLVNTSFDEIICGVLTGMGADASKGIQQVKGCKNVKVVAQNEETCVVYGMPRAAKMAGVVDDMVPLSDVASAMMRK